ncbi:MAG: c-type cytochrome [Parvularculaceae bacterium]|nr:c-type cytochrome [Parvularculaceae bacterium]
MRARRTAGVLLAGVLAAACGSQSAPIPATAEERGLAEFRACAVCHARTDPADPSTLRLIGPSLYGVVGAPSARLADFDYSAAMRRANLIWDEATLDAYLADPQAVVSGTRMSYPGEPDPASRAAIIAYLKTLK